MGAEGVEEDVGEGWRGGGAQGAESPQRLFECVCVVCVCVLCVCCVCVCMCACVCVCVFVCVYVIVCLRGWVGVCQ